MSQYSDYSFGGNSHPSIERNYRDDVNGMVGVENDFDIRDRTETDVEFMNSLYRNTNNDYFLGSWVVKPIIEILLHFTGQPRVECEDKALEKMLNDTYQYRQTEMQQLFKELGLYGTEWAVLGFDQDLKLPTITPKNNSFVVDARYEDPTDQDNPTYVMVRTYGQMSNSKNQDVVESKSQQSLFVDQIFWRETNPVYMKLVKAGRTAKHVDKYLHKYRVRRKSQNSSWETINKEETNVWNTMPVIPFHQARLSSDKYGYSDVSGIVRLTGVYHQVLESAIDTVLYNSKPIPVFTGLSNAKAFIADMYGDISSGDVTGSQGYYDDMDSYFLESEADVKYLELSSAQIDNAKALLGILFYIFVQTSGVPEYMLGAEMNSTYASTAMQATPLTQKIKSKRTDITTSLLRMNVAMAKIYEANSNVKFSTYRTSIQWKDTTPQDKTYLLDALDRVLPLDILTPETILTMLDLVSDPSAEIAKRKTQVIKEVMPVEEKKALVTKIRGKLSTAKERSPIGELDELVEIDGMLKALMGENYLEELGLEE